MNNTDQLRYLGQSIWLDNVSRTLLDDGTLLRYIQQYAICGVTCDWTTFDEAIGNSDAYDADIRAMAATGQTGETLLLELTLADLRRAADLLGPAFSASGATDGWVSMALSPLLAHDAVDSVEAAANIHRLAARPNLMVTIPGTPEGLTAIEESIFLGIPINVSLLFSPAQYLAAAEAYIRGLERRVAAGLDPNVGSVASLLISCWDNAVADTVPAQLRNHLGIAVGRRTYRVYRELLCSLAWRRLVAAGARPQRLLWASTSTTESQLPESWYVEALAAPDTVDAMLERTLLGFAAHGHLQGARASDAGHAEAALARFARSGIDVDALARRLQDEGVEAGALSWQKLLHRIVLKSVRAIAPGSLPKSLTPARAGLAES
jgi:transaldolase